MHGQWRLEASARTGEVLPKLPLDPLDDRIAPESDGGASRLTQLLQLGRQGGAVDEFQQVQGRWVRHGQHRADGGFHPVGLEQATTAQMQRRISKQPRHGIAEAAARLESGRLLCLDHGRAGGQLVHAKPCPAQPGHVEEGQAELALEGAPHGGRVVAQGYQVVLGPDPLRVVFQPGQQGPHHGLALAHRVKRAAAQAGPEPGLEAGSHRVVELRIADVRLAGRTAQPAEHPCAGDAHEDMAIIGGIAVQQGAVQRVVVGQVEKHG